MVRKSSRSVQQSRPVDLPPVPGGDEEELDEETQALQDEGGGGRVGRSKRRHPSRNGGRVTGVEQFSTPASWEDTAKLSEKLAEKTKGRMPSDDGSNPRSMEELQRSLEKELEKHKKRSSRSSWSAYLQQSQRRQQHQFYKRIFIFLLIGQYTYTNICIYIYIKNRFIFITIQFTHSALHLILLFSSLAGNSSGSMLVMLTNINLYLRWQSIPK